MVESLSHLSPRPLPGAGPLAAAVLQPVLSGLQAANDNHEPEPPPAAAAPIPRIGPLLLFDVSRIFEPAVSFAAGIRRMEISSAAVQGSPIQTLLPRSDQRVRTGTAIPLSG